MKAGGHPVVFVGGVPGAGKSFLCRTLADLVSSTRVEVAGQLIRRALHGGEDEYRRPPVRDRNDADRFQELLVEMFTGIHAEHDGPLILDGHFVVPTEDGASPVAAEVFHRLGVNRLVIVVASTEVVIERLRQRSSTRWWDGTTEAIQHLADLELMRATTVGRELGLEPVVFESGGDPLHLVALLQGA